MSATDQATQIPRRRELDVQSVDQYLKRPESRAWKARPTHTSFPVAPSNHTYLGWLTPARNSYCAAAFGKKKAKSAHDIGP